MLMHITTHIQIIVVAMFVLLFDSINFDFKNLQATINISILTGLIHFKCTLKLIATIYTPLL